MTRTDAPFPVPDTRKARLFVGIVRGIGAGISAWFVYLALKQTYRAGVIALQSEYTLSAHVADPTMFWLLIVVSTIFAYALGGIGLYVALSARITGVVAVVGGE